MAGDAKAKIMSPTPVPPRSPPDAVRNPTSVVFQCCANTSVPRIATNADVTAEHVTIAGMTFWILGSSVFPIWSAEIATEIVSSFAIPRSTPPPAAETRAAARRIEDARQDTSAPFSTIDALGVKCSKRGSARPVSGGSSVAAAFAASLAWIACLRGGGGVGTERVTGLWRLKRSETVNAVVAREKNVPDTSSSTTLRETWRGKAESAAGSGTSGAEKNSGTPFWKKAREGSKKSTTRCGTSWLNARMISKITKTAIIPTGAEGILTLR
mmetsp:Transcript_5046/g.11466  ORF Transcript_5046/g.11466 Transcript_5046/m.11466 type:complete len:269 (-) Transcript_5046:468-1274(-)